MTQRWKAEMVWIHTDPCGPTWPSISQCCHTAALAGRENKKGFNSCQPFSSSIVLNDFKGL